MIGDKDQKPEHQGQTGRRAGESQRHRLTLGEGGTSEIGGNQIAQQNDQEKGQKQPVAQGGEQHVKEGGAHGISLAKAPTRG